MEALDDAIFLQTGISSLLAGSKSKSTNNSKTILIQPEIDLIHSSASVFVGLVYFLLIHASRIQSFNESLRYLLALLPGRP